MNRVEALVKWINLKHLEENLKVADGNNCVLNDIGRCDTDANILYAYIMDTYDKEVAVKCCGIDRSLFYRFVSADTIGMALSACVRTLFDIHNWVLKNVYNISDEDIKDCRYFIGRADGKCHKTDNDGNEQQEMYDPEGTSSKPQYSDALRSLFKNRVDLIDGLCGLTDKEIAQRIKALAKERDKFGKPLIQSPANYGNKTKFADALKENGLIKCTANQFRRNL